MAVLEKPRQLSLFAERLPTRPYCSDDLTYGLKIRPAQQALEQRYIQYNHPAIIKWLVYDIDRRYLGFGNDWEKVAPPNIVVINRANGHAHYLYGMVDGVTTTSASRQAPIRLLAATYEGYRHALGADPDFTQMICKNPLSDHWQVEVIREDLYDLSELAEYVDLKAATERIRKTPKKHRMGVGRNCSLFDSLRTWAYKWVGDYCRAGAYERWISVCVDQADKLNTFDEPLGFNEVKGIARSVARWTFRHYDGTLGPESLSAAGLTPESFSLLQSSLGKMGNAKRWGNNAEKKAEAKRLKEGGATQVEIARALEVNQATVSRWLKG